MSTPTSNTATNSAENTGARAGEGLKGIFGVIHGAGEAIRGGINGVVDGAGDAVAGREAGSVNSQSRSGNSGDVLNKGNREVNEGLDKILK